MGIDSRDPQDDREVLFEHGGLKYDQWGIAIERSGAEEKLAQQRLADNASLIERCKQIKSRLPKSAPPPSIKSLCL